jgi:hypothetical protein
MANIYLMKYKEKVSDSAHCDMLCSSTVVPAKDEHQGMQGVQKSRDNI